jgi:BolA family transcriptional regulator, general stress-responsive regulator
LSSNLKIKDQIDATLKNHLPQEWLEVVNESSLHSFNPTGESHFKVVIVSSAFEGVLLLKRHRQVQELLAEVLPQIRALSLHTFTPREWQERQGTPIPGSQCASGRKAL